MVEVKRGADEASATLIARYVYDADGNRTRKIEKTGQGDHVTDYLIDPTFAYAQVVEETTTQNGQTESTHYVWGAGLLQHTRGGQGTYYHADGQGTVKALTDGNGHPTEAYEYGAFGEPLNPSGTAATPYRYTGEHYDETARLQYHQARWYDPAVGRWTGMDPHPGHLSRPASLHKYVYGENTPVNLTGPSGLATLSEKMAGISLVGGTASVAVSVSWAINGSRTAYLAVASVPYLASQGQRIVPLIQGGGKFAHQALQSSIY